MKNLLKKIASITLILNILLTNASATEIIELDPKPAMTDKSHLLIDLDTSHILMEHNINEKIYPASTTKIMTAMVALDYLELTDIVTVVQESFNDLPIGSSHAGLVTGEELTVYDLLYCIMLPSANEGANAIALHVGEGDMQTFVNLMNQKAVQIGAYNTNFMNPSGLHDDNHYTTAYDMALITKVALNYETIVEIGNVAQKTLQPNNKKPDGNKVFTSNMLIYRTSDYRYYKYAKGLKTGSTSQAGKCLVSYAENDGRRLLSIIFGAENDSSGVNPVFTYAKNMFEWGYDNYISKELIDTLKPEKEVAVKLSAKSDYIAVVPENSLSGIVPKNFDAEKIVYTYNLPEIVSAPIKEGQKIGTVDVSYEGIYYGSINLLALNNVEVSDVLYYVDLIENFFQSSLFFRIIGSVGGIFLVLFLIRIINQMKRKKRRYRKIQPQRRASQPKRRRR